MIQLPVTDYRPARNVMEAASNGAIAAVKVMSHR